MDSNRVAAIAGCSMRQLHTWVDKGWLRPDRVDGQGRAGVVFDFSNEEMHVARRMGTLVKAGLYPEKAHKLARGNAKALADLELALSPCRLLVRGPAQTAASAEPCG